MAKNCLYPLCLMEAISVAFDGENTELNLKKLDRMWNKQRKNSCQIQECSNLIIATIPAFHKSNNILWYIQTA